MASPTTSSTARKSGLVENVCIARVEHKAHLPSDPIHGLDCGPAGLNEKAGFLSIYATIFMTVLTTGRYDRSLW